MSPHERGVVHNVIVLRIPMRGYELSRFAVRICSVIVTNPHEGL